MTEPSIFTKIIKGEMPCHKVYEDDYVFVFMSIYPIQPGQVVIASKRQVSNFYELEGDEYDGFMRAIKNVGLRLKEVYPNKKRIGVIIEGLEVDHAHAKVFPVDSGEEFRNDPPTNVEPDHATLAEIAKKLEF